MLNSICCPRPRLSRQSRLALKVTDPDRTKTMPLPKIFTAPNDLTDAEFGRLDELLVEAPAQLFVGDAVMLDGYLCGVLVQPTIIAQDEWLQRIFEIDDGIDEDDEGDADDIAASGR